ncbi:(2Fe-2S)-binding protein [Streptomyces sp. NPDC047017]|uniref:(2Fe-2S)-binding protein n=1 Tax=Streptomyces sp. NPDC047017 TaxID=3155024 RepID=UPI0033CF68B4
MEPDADLAALRRLGGFFVLRTGEPPPAPAPLPTLADAYADPDGIPAPTGPAGPADPPDPLSVRVRRVAAGIRAPEARVAASVAHLGLAARLWSAALGCAVLYGRVPGLDPCLLRWDPAGSAPDDLWLTRVRTVPANADTLAATVLLGHLEPLAAALRARYRLAPGLLRGNAASALAGAARQAERWARDEGRPETGERARELAARLLGHPLLAGAGTLGPGGFRRRSCCLYYRVPGGGVCGDCCFRRPPRSSARAGSG